MVNQDDLGTLMQERRALIDRTLSGMVAPASQAPGDLHRAMRYTLLSPGKRVRAILTLLASRHLGGQEEYALSSACALEMVHAASLILDDLPAMDNASLRRGLPSNHQAFGEATAILAAIGLLNRAFGIVAEDKALSDATRTQLSAILSRAIGSEGLVAGQEQDLKWPETSPTRGNVEVIHARKTGALFSAAGEMAAAAIAADEDRVMLMRDLGMKLGLAFQILDDLIDATATPESAGKDVAQDAGSPSLVHVIGADAASREAQRYVREALALIDKSAASEDSLLRHFALTLIAGLENKLKAAG
jgi:geranylgeranyl diphosphate synthase type II